MAWVYILISKLNHSYYIGASRDIEERLRWHNDIEKNVGHSKKGIPWKLFLKLECKDMNQALLIEKHIKKMKSRKYIENLNKYPEMREKLIKRFA